MAYFNLGDENRMSNFDPNDINLVLSNMVSILNWTSTKYFQSLEKGSDPNDKPISTLIMEYFKYSDARPKLFHWWKYEPFSSKCSPTTLLSSQW